MTMTMTIHSVMVLLVFSPDKDVFADILCVFDTSYSKSIVDFLQLVDFLFYFFFGVVWNSPDWLLYSCGAFVDVQFELEVFKFSYSIECMLESKLNMQSLVMVLVVLLAGGLIVLRCFC